MQNHLNITLIKTFFEAYSNKDTQKIKQIISPQIKWHIPGNHQFSGVKSGVDEVIEYLGKLNSYAFDAEPIVMGVNDNFVIDCHRNWSNLENGKNLSTMSCLLWRIFEGKIIEVYNFPENQKKVDDFFTNNIR